MKKIITPGEKNSPEQYQPEFQDNCSLRRSQRTHFAKADSPWTTLANKKSACCLLDNGKSVPVILEGLAGP